MSNRSTDLRRALCSLMVILLLSGLLAGCDYVRPILSALPFIGQEPTATPSAPTVTPVPTLTPQAAPTRTAAPPTPEAAVEATATLMTGVLDAKYVRDINVPDGTVMTPGQTFLKSWEIENTGEVPWPDGTELRLVDGPAMGPLESVTLNSRAAGERTEISVELKAPDAAGTYRTYWQLCVGEACFGTRFYVEIKVQAG
jgi:hypothetical protein